MKKFKLFLIVFLLFVGINYVKAIDTSEKVYDYAQVLTAEEESSLKEMAYDFIEKYNMDIVMVTVSNHSKSTTKDYAMDFYDYNDFGVNSTNDGIIFVIDFNFGNTSFDIRTTGEAIRMYDDKRIESILDDIDVEYYKDTKNYYNMFSAFIKSSSKYASMGIPSSNENTYIDKNGDYTYSKEKTTPWGGIVIASFVVSTVIVLIFIFKNRMVKKSSTATYYIDSGSVHITGRNDRFISTHTTSHRINTDSGGGGGSSISRGSSGISHGGGGRSH